LAAVIGGLLIGYECRVKNRRLTARRVVVAVVLAAAYIAFALEFPPWGGIAAGALWAGLFLLRFIRR
jgi:hypothetical protein